MAGIAVYSTRFIAESGFTGSAAFEVPDGYRAVVRDIDAVCFTSEGPTIEAGIGDSAVFWAFTYGVVLLVNAQSWRGRVVLNPGEQLVILTNAPLDFVASGYLLSLP